MERQIGRIKAYQIRWILVIAAVMILTIGILIFWTAGDKADKGMTERVKTQVLISARSQAFSIAEFFKDKQVDLLLLAESEPVKTMEEKEGRKVLKVYVDNLYQKSGNVVDVVRVDKSGVIVWNINIKENREGEGALIADREYFIWAKEQKEPGEVFISKPVIARGGLFKGNWAVATATPVFYQGTFNGIVFVSFLVEDLTKKYITPVALSLETSSLIIAQDGTIVASNESGLVGRNAIELAQQKEWKGREEMTLLLKSSLEGKEKVVVHPCFRFGGFDNPKKAISSYSPIRVNGNLWSMWISVPYEGAIKFAWPIKLGQAQGFALGAIGGLILVLIFVFGVRIAQRDAFVDGFRDGRDGVKKLKKKS